MNRSILCQRFIQNSHKEIIFGTQNGYCIYSTGPFAKICEEDLGGGVGIIDINKNKKCVYIVGGGIKPCYPPNLLIIRDYADKNILQQIYFKDLIKSICARDDLIAVCTEKKVFIYDSETYEIIREIETCLNARGLFAINTYLGHNNKMRLLTLSKTPGCLILYDKFSDHCLNIVKIHDSPIEYFTIDRTGNFIATCSKKGTIIKIYDINLKKYREYRRGFNQKKIYLLQFNNDSTRLLCISDTSLHVFKLDEETSFIGNIINTNFSFCVYTCEGKYINAQFIDNERIMVYDREKIIEIKYDNKGKCTVENLNTVYTVSNYPFTKY